MTALTVAPSPASTRHAAIPARSITLADGQAWGLALPGLRYQPAVVPEVDPLGRSITAIQLVVRTGYPWPIERLVLNLRSACQAGTDPEDARRRFGALMALAEALLRRAHHLSASEAFALLDLDGDGLVRLVDAVIETVAGDAAGQFTPANVSPTGGGHAFLA